MRLPPGLQGCNDCELRRTNQTPTLQHLGGDDDQEVPRMTARLQRLQDDDNPRGSKDEHEAAITTSETTRKRFQGGTTMTTRLHGLLGDEDQEVARTTRRLQG